MVDRHKLARSQVDGFVDVAFHDHLCTLQAIIDVHKAACLLAIAPNGNLVLAGEFGLNHLAANRRRSLLAAAIPCAVRPINIVEARHTAHQAKIFFEVPAHAFAEKLFPAVAVFRHRWVRIAFLQRDNVLVDLLVAVVHARRRRIEKALHTLLLRSLQHVRIGQHAQHAQRFIVFDKAHAAHICGKLIDQIDAFNCLLAIRAILQIER